MVTSRKPQNVMTLSLTADKPILPATVKTMLDKIPFYSDIVEMRVTTNAGPIPTRRVDIFYTTSMPWEAQ
jgi:hypothetical protein